MKIILKNNIDFPFEQELSIANKAKYYMDDFVKIAKHPIWKEVSIRGLGLSAKTIKRAYKEMEEIKFSGTIIDYLCFIALNYALSQAHVVDSLIILKSTETMKIFRTFFERHQIYLILSCRLMLTDENYLDYAFNYSKAVKNDFFDEAKKYMFKKMNELLVVSPEMNTQRKSIVKLH
jgi:hypothetical protein